MSDARNPMVRQAFHQELDAIDDAFVTAGLQVAEAVPALSAGFLSGDDTTMPQAEAMAIEVGNACEYIDEAGFVLLARQAPVGGDLRRLVALLRMTVDVDRSANLLRHACFTLRTFNPRFLDEPVRSQLEELSVRSGQVFAAGLDAWRRRDALAVMDVDQADEDVDELQRALLRESTNLEDDPGPEMLVLGLLARYYERIADHGVEIARDAAFVATGQRIRVGRRRDEAAAAEGTETAPAEGTTPEPAGGDVADPEGDDHDGIQ